MARRFTDTKRPDAFERIGPTDPSISVLHTAFAGRHIQTPSGGRMGLYQKETTEAVQTGHLRRVGESLRVRLRDWLMADSAAEREALAFMHRTMGDRLGEAMGDLPAVRKFRDAPGRRS